MWFICKRMQLAGGTVLLPVVTCTSFRSLHLSLMGPARGKTGQQRSFAGDWRGVKMLQIQAYFRKKNGPGGTALVI